MQQTCNQNKLTMLCSVSKLTFAHITVSLPTIQGKILHNVEVKNLKKPGFETIFYAERFFTVNVNK